MSIYDKQIAYKPTTYPEVYKYRDAVRHSYWTINEFDLTKDIDDYKTQLSKKHKHAITNTMLAIAQVESANVKSFWAKCGDMFPKPEIYDVGYTFAESEVRHAEALTK